MSDTALILRDNRVVSKWPIATGRYGVVTAVGCVPTAFCKCLLIMADDYEVPGDLGVFLLAPLPMTATYPGRSDAQFRTSFPKVH